MDFQEVEKRVREDEANSLEAFRKGTEDSPTLFRAVAFETEEIKATEDSGAMRIFIASTEDEDRGGDVVRQDGWNLKNFKRNPVYQWAHNYALPPIGTVPKIWTEGKRLLNTVRFDMNDPLGAQISRKVDEGILKAQSVGFRPLEFQERDSKKGAFGAFEFLKNELLEISSVPIPMNQAALVKAIDLAERAPIQFFMNGFPGIDPVEQEVPEEKEIEPVIEVVEEEVIEAKAGRVLSIKNFDRLKSVHDTIGDILDSARTADPQETPDEDPAEQLSMAPTDEPVEELEAEEIEQTGFSGEDAERVRKALTALREEN